MIIRGLSERRRDKSDVDDHADARKSATFARRTPGTRLQYHPRAAHLTQAMVIEAVTGQDYRAVIRDKVLAPLGLTNDIYVGVPAIEQERCADPTRPEPRDIRRN